ncbi:hypothetical protein V2J09_015288 [Rumex salicifolius]
MTSGSGDGDEKSRGFLVGHHHESNLPPPPPPQPAPPPHYGTFEGVPAFPPPRQPAVGFPQPTPPPGISDPPPGYQTVPGYAVAEGQPVRERRLPCCGLGLGWCLFIIGFFLGGIPWYVAAVLMICTRRTMDLREKPGYILCTIAAIIETIAIIFRATRDH